MASVVVDTGKRKFINFLSYKNCEKQIISPFFLEILVFHELSVHRPLIILGLIACLRQR